MLTSTDELGLISSGPWHRPGRPGSLKLTTIAYDKGKPVAKQGRKAVNLTSQFPGS